jgi:hypothetical protein
MKFLLSSLLFLALSVVTTRQSFGETEPIRKVTLPVEVREELLTLNIPDAIKGKVWNRWTSDNFTVLSLNDTQAQYLHKHLELVKVWVFSRWGLYDVPFSAECKLICVDDPELYEKMFKINSTRVEIRRQEDRIEESVIFVLINDAPSHTIPVPLTEVCLAEFALRYQQNFPWWAYRGMSLLNGALDQIRSSLDEFVPTVEQNKKAYFSEGLLSMTKEAYLKLDDDKKRIYDQCAMVFCLMLRQEFGQNSFHHFLNKSTHTSGSDALVDILGFEGNEDFDRTFRRYMIDLMRDIKDNKTPDGYLQIHEVD